jgi:hypothetical protein
LKDSFGAEMVQIIKATVVAGSEPFLYLSLVIAVAAHQRDRERRGSRRKCAGLHP